MPTNTFNLTVRTPEQQVLKLDNALSVQLNSETGQMEIMAGHATTVGTILFTTMKVTTPESANDYVVQRGMVFVSQEKKEVQVLAYQCQKIQDVEYKSAKEYLEFVEERLKAGDDLNDYQLKYLENEKIAMVQQMKKLEKKEA